MPAEKREAPMRGKHSLHSSLPDWLHSAKGIGEGAGGRGLAGIRLLIYPRLLLHILFAVLLSGYMKFGLFWKKHDVVFFSCTSSTRCFGYDLGTDAMRTKQGYLPSRSSRYFFLVLCWCTSHCFDHTEHCALCSLPAIRDNLPCSVRPHRRTLGMGQHRSC